MISYTLNPLTGNFDAISSVTLTAVGSTPNANGASLSAQQALTLQPASASFPGLVSTTTQSFAGSKTFTGLLNADGGIDRSTAGTLSIGTLNASVINIGNSGATVNIQGTTIYENTPMLRTADPLITVNAGGGVGSGNNAGIEVEENAIITGYAETSANRNSWIFKAPNTAGIATVTPGASGFTIDQGSHNPVTLGTANGLSLATQVLSLGLSSASTTGALSSTDYATFNAKQPAGNYITALTGDAAATGPGSVALTLATVNANVGSFGSASSVATFTTNAKGLITAAASVPIAIPFTQVSGTVPVAQGGTGQTSYTNGQLLIGNTTGNTLTKTTLTAGAGITVTNGAGSITIASTGGSRTNYVTNSTGDFTQSSPTTNTWYIVDPTMTFALPAGTYQIIVSGTGYLSQSALSSSAAMYLQLGMSLTPGAALIDTPYLLLNNGQMATMGYGMPFAGFVAVSQDITLALTTNIYVNCLWVTTGGSPSVGAMGFIKAGGTSPGFAMRLVAVRVA